jgi:hypothetical protein
MSIRTRMYDWPFRTIKKTVSVVWLEAARKSLCARKLVLTLKEIETLKKTLACRWNSILFCTAEEIGAENTSRHLQIGQAMRQTRGYSGCNLGCIWSRWPKSHDIFVVEPPAAGEATARDVEPYRIADILNSLIL